MRLAMWACVLATVLAVCVLAEPSKAALGPGDRLQISVRGETELSKDYMVDEAGQVKMELLGSVHAGGMTLEEFQTSLERQLARFVRKPAVTILAFQRVAVAGGVHSPGAFDFPKDQPIRLMDAVIKAGGFVERARKSRVLLVRRATATGTPQTQLIDVQGYLKKGKAERNPVLAANDVVYVDVEDAARNPHGIGAVLEKALPIAAALLGH